MKNGSEGLTDTAQPGGTEFSMMAGSCVSRLALPRSLRDSARAGPRKHSQSKGEGVFTAVARTWRPSFLEDGEAFDDPLSPVLEGFHRFGQIHIILTTLSRGNRRGAGRFIVDPLHQRLENHRRDGFEQITAEHF